MWLEAKTGDVQSSCLATATVTALAAAAATAAAAGTVVAAAAAAAAATSTTNTTSCTATAEPTNLRHSASFSCLSGNKAATAPATVAHLPSDYRVRTATLSAVDLDYGFVIRPGAVAAAAVQLSSPSALPKGYSYCGHCVGSAGDQPPSEESSLSSVTAAAIANQVDDDSTRADCERPSLSRKVLIKKSVSLLNPNVWWTPKFRRGVKSNKNKEKNLQEMQTQKRWRSLGALLRVSNANSSRSSTITQSSLPAPQSFYLLDDFLKPSTNRRRGNEENRRRNDSCSNSTSLQLPFTTAETRIVARSMPARYPEYENSTSAECCSSLCRHYGGGCDRDPSSSSFDSTVLVS